MVHVSTTSTVFKMIWNQQQSKNIGWACVHKGHRTLIKFLLLELPWIYLEIFALYTLHSRIWVSATSTVFKIMIWK